MSDPFPLPALSLVASAGKRQTICDLAVEAENRGFSGIACPTLGGALGLCVSLAHLTKEIPFFTSIQGIYSMPAAELAGIAAHIHEVSGGRFSLGLGVSHESMVRRLGVPMGKPLEDMTAYVESLHAQQRFSGPLPPIYLAALRDKMLDLALTSADGALWANSSLRYTADQVTRLDPDKREGRELAVMLPTVITADRAAGLAVHRKTLTTYVRMPNYRNYWKAAGYVEEMEAIEEALGSDDRDALPGLMSDAWLRDCTVSGSPSEVREQFDAWWSIGVRPIAVMSSTSGGQAKAVAELFDAYH